MTNNNELNKALFAYFDKHPNAESPLDHIAFFGVDELLTIMQKANGRFIKFTEDKTQGQQDNAPMTFKYE